MTRRLLVSSAGESEGGVHLVEHDAGGLRLLSSRRLDAPAWAIAPHPGGATASIATWGAPHAILTLAVDETLAERGVSASGGRGPCFLLVDPGGDLLLVAHYEEGGVTVHRLDEHGAAGAPLDRRTFAGTGPDRERQERSHPHCLLAAGAGGVHVVDLGTDSIHLLSLDPLTGALTPEADRTVLAPPGTGPRHAVRVGDALIVSGELSARILVLPAEGVPDHGGCGLPATELAGGQRDYPGDVVVIPGDRFVCLANRGAGTIAVFAIERRGLTPVSELEAGGAWPMKLDYADGYLYCAVKDSGLVRAWRLDPRTGAATLVGEVAVESPTWIAALEGTQG